MVTVIIPVYNGEKYIAYAIDSVLKQTYQEIEIIVIDDGSTDNTACIVKSYPNVRYVYQVNAGPAAARNFGISMAQGQYVAFLDADDISMPNRIEKQVDYFKYNPNVGVVYCDVDVIDEGGELLYTLYSEGHQESKENFLAMTLYRHIIPCPSAMMIRKECLEKTHYPEDYIHAEDYLFTIWLAEKYNFGYINESLYGYRRHNKNLTNDHNKQVLSEIQIVQQLGIDKIVNIINRSSFSNYEKELLFARILIKIKRFNQAESQLKKISKKDEFVNFNLGICCYMQKKYNEAQHYFENAIQCNNGMAEAYNNAGCASIRLQQLKRAEKYFTEALKLREGYMDAHINLEQCEISFLFEPKVTMRELRSVLTKYV